MSSAETITADDLLDALARHDVLETFCQLPTIDQEKFSRLIGKARSNDSHWRRIEALVLALKAGPLQPGEHHPLRVYIESHE